jgi:hypothetical protein
MHHEHASIPSTRPTRSHFIMRWMWIHSALLLAGAVMVSILPIAPFILAGGYSLLVRRCMAAPGHWTLTTVLGCIAGGMVSTSIAPQHWGVIVGVVGLGIGMTNLLTLPWRGVRTLGWPVVTVLGVIAAASVMTWIAGVPVSVGGWEIICVLGGAVYGLITGPVLFTLLHAEDSRRV